MSDLSDAMLDGITEMTEQNSVTVDIDGGVTFLAVADQLERGNTPSEIGNREIAGVRLSFDRDSWTPVVGKLLTVDGVGFRVALVDYSNPATYTVTCSEGNL